MTYADIEKVKTRLGSLYKPEDGTGTLTEDMVIIAVDDADTNIKSQLREARLTPPLDTDTDIDDIQTAANLYALSDLLDTAYESTDGERNPESVAKEQQADGYITRYINRPPVDDDERAPRMRSFVAGNTIPNSTINMEDPDGFGDDEW